MSHFDKDFSLLQRELMRTDLSERATVCLDLLKNALTYFKQTSSSLSTSTTSSPPSLSSSTGRSRKSTQSAPWTPASNGTLKMGDVVQVPPTVSSGIPNATRSLAESFSLPRGQKEDSDISNYSVCETLLARMQVLAWEEIHTGPWKSVDMIWRELYSLGAIGRSECYLMLAENSSKCGSISASGFPSEASLLRSAIQAIDLGLMLGSPEHRIILSSLASLAEQKLSKTNVSCESMLKSRSKLPGTAREPPHKRTRATKSDLDAPRILKTYGTSRSTRAQSQVSMTRSASDLSADPSEVPRLQLKHAIPRKELPSLMHFADNHMNPSVPVIITGAMETWPACAVNTAHSWSSVSYLRTHLGLRTVPVEVGSSYLSSGWSQRLMAGNELLDQHLLPDFVRLRCAHVPPAQDVTSLASLLYDKPGIMTSVAYLAQHQLLEQIPALRRDIIIPDYCCLSVGSEDSSSPQDSKSNSRQVQADSMPSINFWLGPSRTVSPLHFDPDHNLLTQVFGYKYVRLYSPKSTPMLYPNSETMLRNTSQVDVAHPNLEKFPLFAKAPFVECILGPKEMLYIPPKFWHYVQSLTVSLSVSFWWN